MSEALAMVAELVRRETGIVVKEAQLPALAAALGRVAPDMDAERFVAESSGRSEDTALLNRLVDEVTVQETYFFRELRELQAIEWQRLLEGEREGGLGVVRVWVAACATGEEAYSLAILASEALGPVGTPVTILGTDISSAALERAAAGEGYTERSVRNLPPHLRQRYFTEEKGRYRVRESIRSLVRFRHHNLIGDPSPPPGEVSFDVIACRNVLIYFDLATVEPVISSLESALRPEGHLILGAADRLTGTAGALGRTAPGAQAERRRRPPAAKRPLRRPLGLEPKLGEGTGTAGRREWGGGGDRAVPRRRAEDSIEDALLAADAGELDAAIEIVEALLAKDPLLADAYFVRGLVELGLGDTRAATASLRRSLYLDPSFGLAAFELGRAHDRRGNAKAARRAYERALRTLDPEDERHRALLAQVDLGDVIAACEARLRSEEGTAPP
ncbi:MAG TPA: CheR family methyltransferase [Solirubrobacterales bacterium]|jgi:chemotaxis protein methyltransferase CheR|nr:CheR family methyltransferase [Solirubrobacterales bacterium]